VERDRPVFAFTIFKLHNSSSGGPPARAIRRDAIALYLAARDPRVSWHAKVLAAVVAAYALSPIDLIPDFIPVLGYLDEVVLLPLAMAAVMRLIDPAIIAEHRAAAAGIAAGQ
jgi:uncharacterized membrane protein YkvA (DUF1232 family)